MAYETLAALMVKSVMSWLARNSETLEKAPTVTGTAGETWESRIGQFSVPGLDR